MSTFERIKTATPVTRAAANLQRAAKRYRFAKEAELTGAEFLSHVLGVHYKHGTSLRGAIIAAVADGPGCYDVTEGATDREIRAAVNYLTDRAAMSEPFCDKRFAYENGQIVVSATPGAREALKAYLAMSDKELAVAARCLPGKPAKPAKVAEPAEPKVAEAA